MTYTKTVWVAGGSPGISADNLNKIEQGISDAQTSVANLQASIPTTTLQLTGNQTVTNPINVQGSGALLALWYELRDAVNDTTPQAANPIAMTLEGPIDYTNKVVASQSVYFAKIYGYIKFTYAENYTIYATSDDAVRVIIDGTSVFGESGWGKHSSTTYTGTVGAARANIWLPITIEHVNYSGSERLLLEWSSTSQARQTIPASAMKWTLLPFVDNGISAKEIYAYRTMKLSGNNVWHAGNMMVASSAPSSPAVGDVWIDTSVTLS